jgi:hypothetical protein
MKPTLPPSSGLSPYASQPQRPKAKPSPEERVGSTLSKPSPRGPLQQGATQAAPPAVPTRR